jgi:hypothetical protein
MKALARRKAHECQLAFVWRVRLIFHCGFEAANSISDSFAEFRQLLRSEDEQSNSENYQQMRGLKQSFKHKSSFINRHEDVWRSCKNGRWT